MDSYRNSLLKECKYRRVIHMFNIKQDFVHDRQIFNRTYVCIGIVRDWSYLRLQWNPTWFKFPLNLIEVLDMDNKSRMTIWLRILIPRNWIFCQT